MTSYMDIVKQTACDMVPKAITYHIIIKLMNYIDKNLLIKMMDIPTDDYVSKEILRHDYKEIDKFN